MNPLPRSRVVRRRAAVACSVLASLFVCGSAAAQFGPSIPIPENLPTVTPAPPSYPPTVASTAAGPYYAPPAWSQTLAPNVRFIILSNFNREAVLDRETGLVWTRQSQGERAPRFAGCGGVGGQLGWRLPSVSELQSLIDASVPFSGQPRLPIGHPFLLHSRFYWASDIRTLGAFDNQFYVDLTSGSTSTAQIEGNNDEEGVLCVR
jgi:hypothetical protein